jgi:predicted nucleotidyltransferase
MTERKLTLDSTLPRLREVFEEFKGVEVAILFGSMVRDWFSAHDIDLALKLEREDLLEVGWIVFQIAKTLHVNEDRVDVTLLNHANPILLSKILRDGIVIKAQPEAIEKLLQRAQQSPDASIEFKQWATLNPKLDKAIIMSRVEEIKRNADFIRNEILCKRLKN